MKPKQLANVLIRILGLSMIVEGLPSLINKFINWLQLAADNRTYAYNGGNSHLTILVLYGLLPIAVGIFLLLKSRWVTEKLFKDEVG